MKKTIKKALCLVLAAVMAVSSGIAAFAVTGYEPSADDARTVVVYNVEADVTVTAYQIIDATYDEKGNGLTGYVVADGLTIEDLEDPTADEINAIATAIYDGTLTSLASKVLTPAASGTEITMATVAGEDTAETYTTTSYSYYGDLEAGMWIILVSDSNTTIYNPMIVSNWYEDANLASSLTAGTVDAEGNFEEGIYSCYYVTTDGTVVYAEKTYYLTSDSSIEVTENANKSDTSEGDFYYVNSDGETVYVDADDVTTVITYTDSEGNVYSASDISETVENNIRTVIYAKSDSITVDKDIVNFTGNDGSETVTEISNEEASTTGDTTHGDDATDDTEGADYDIGDYVQFEIKTTIPDYADTYFDNETHDAQFTIIDSLSSGFDAVDAGDITVTVGGTVYTASDSTYEVTLYDAYEYNGTIYYVLANTNGTYSIYMKESDGTYEQSGNDVSTIPSGYSYTGQEIVIDFAEDFIADHGFESVVVTYSAVLNNDALIVGGEDAYANPNSVDLVYSNNPTTVFNTDENGTGDTVYVYTFSLTDEIAKVYDDDGADTTTNNVDNDDSDIDDDINESSNDDVEAEAVEGAVSASGNDVTVTNPLAGATFTIYYDSSCADEYEYTAWVYDTDEDSDTYGELIQSSSMTTGDDGYVQFYGLSEGTYYITETEAPSGYAINDTIYEIVIDAVYDTTSDTTDGNGSSSKDGLLTSWSLTVTNLSTGESRVNTYDVTYTTSVSYYDYTSDAVSSSESGLTNYDTVYTLSSTTVTAGGSDGSSNQEPTAILDNRLFKLPSTGGMGIYIAIILSIGIVVIAGTASTKKRKNAQ